MASNDHRLALYLAAVLLFAVPSGAAAQTATLSGRVLDATSAEPVSQATIIVGDRTATSAGDGGFTVSGLAIGTHIVLVHAFGYDTSRSEIVLRSDTVVEIRLPPTPIRLDALHGVAGSVVLRGLVRDAGSNRTLRNVAVLAVGGRSTRSDRLGRFRLELPRSAPAAVSLRSFGYLPLTDSLELAGDTAITFYLEPDEVVGRMIAHQVRRLEERATPRRTAGMPPVDREELLASNANLYQMLDQRGYLRRVRCVLVDDVQYFGHERAGILRTTLPEDVERVELLYRGAMLRVYTRDFIRRMVMGQVAIRRPLYVGEASPPVCQ
ncbi:MAG TPA: carboxypeptidase regulatory-like domain-containing protein [Longimicrobiales bacterium]|nr:carboxypeptidase regulatory-like domain-containing protein [Longimicrobiales bacterium]